MGLKSDDSFFLKGGAQVFLSEGWNSSGLDLISLVMVYVMNTIIMWE